MSYFMKVPCKHCPFRRDVKPFLHPDRGTELAYHAQNPYNSFACHKTTVSDEEYGGDGENMIATSDSLECAGFITLQICEGASIPEGFTPSYDLCYGDVWEMAEAYEDNNIRDPDKRP